jgi:DNA-directed RNA polymerase sigma subunit (sigma70/sigma32)
LKISSERVRQIKDRALQRLRHVTRSQLLKIYIH